MVIIVTGLKKNPNVVFRKTEDGADLSLPDVNILIELDNFSMTVFRAIEAQADFNALVNAVSDLLPHFGMEDMTRAELEDELDAFLLSLLRQGVFILNKSVLFQPYTVSVQGDCVELYFPYYRCAYQVTPALYEQLKQVTVTTYRMVKLVPEAAPALWPFLDTLSAPVALDEYVDYQHTQSRRLVIIPTTACNLCCQYCYAWRSDKPVHHISYEIVEAGIQYTGLNALDSDSPSIDISFMGGGEPTCNWSALQHAVEYARAMAEENEVPFSSTLTTNGVLSDAQIDWIIENITFVKISFDGIQEIQERQRPAKTGSSFEKAVHTMEKLSTAGSNFLVRITVTNESVHNLKDSVEFLVRNFTPQSIIINPVYVCGSCASHGVGSINADMICQSFDDVQDLGVEKHIDIVIPYDKVTYMDVPQLPFCGFQKGNCFLTPEGYISACSEIDGTDDSRAHIFFFGAWDADRGELIVNEEKEVQLQEISTAYNQQCQSCGSQNFCPGPCLVRKTDEATLQAFLKLRQGKPFEESFSPEEIELLMNGKHSAESRIQCGMTQQLTSRQVHRILSRPEMISRLSLHACEEDISDYREIGVLKAVSIRCQL